MHPRALLCTLLLLAMTACGTTGVSFKPSLVNKSELVVDQFVEVSPLAVAVQPMAVAPERPRALFVPFRMLQPSDDSRRIAQELSQVFWNQWLSSAVLPILAFDPDQLNRGQKDLIRLARERGAQLVVTGAITAVYGGGSTGDSYLSLRLEVYDVFNEQLIWSMEQAGRMQADLNEDYVFFARRTRLPTSPLYAITTTLAAHMGTQLIAWRQGPEALPEGAPPQSATQPTQGYTVRELGPTS